jgi:hypothetical protein
MSVLIQGHVQPKNLATNHCDRRCHCNRDLEHDAKIVKAADVQTAFLSALGFFATVQNTLMIF